MNFKTSIYIGKPVNGRKHWFLNYGMTGYYYKAGNNCFFMADGYEYFKFIVSRNELYIP